MNSPRRRIAAILAILLVSASAAAAQTIQGRVLDGETGAPIAGTIVKALDAAGDTGTGTLTNDQGAFTLVLPPAFQLANVSVERIGYATQRFGASRFSGGASVDLLVDSAPVELGGITVTATNLCGTDFRNSGAIQSIWDEVRKSLEATEMSQENRVVRYEVENFERDLRPANYDDVLRGTSQLQRVSAAEPYRSISVSQMTLQGWIEGSPTSGMELYAPNAEILLTDEFAAQHCFRGEVDDDAIRLHFQPNRERRSIPEVEGTLILDPQTSELTAVEFRYVGMPDINRGGHAGGEIHFYGAPNGLRIVREWAIRAPAMRSVRTGVGTLAREELQVVFVHEEGGRVLAIENDGETLTLSTEPLDLGSPAADDDGDGAKLHIAMSRPVGRSAGMDLVVRNDDSRPYRVTEVQLRGCRNTAVPCDQYPVDVLVPAGQSRVVFRLRKQNVLEAFSYSWEFAGQSEDAQIEVAEVEPDLSATVEAQTLARGRSTLLTEAQIPAGRYGNAYDLIRGERPQWLNTRAISSFNADPAEIRVYLDGVLITPDPSSPAERALREIRADEIVTAERIDASSASIRWGTGHQAGAILITTPRGARR